MICERCGTVFCWDGDSSPDRPSPPKLYCSESCKRRQYQMVKHRKQNRRRRRESPTACAERGKRVYPSAEAAAEDAVRLLSAEGSDYRARALEPYKCPCGQWHLRTDQDPATPPR